jgi:HlyD family secretion protein
MNKIIIGTLILMTACNRNKNEPDASGTFETVETIVSAEAAGVIRELDIDEGMQVKKGQVVGYIDSTQLYLRKKQLVAQSKAVLSRSPDINAQVAALEEQLKQVRKEEQRISNLLKADAATQKQLDDVTSQGAVIQKQIEALRSSLGITSAGLNQETVPISIQVEQLNDQLSKCRITNPINGTVLVKYAQANEMTMPGKPLYKIADISNMILRAYVSGDQLSAIRTGQKVTVLVDDKEGKYKTHEGVIEWISDKAEFTPKTIQTKEERANLVYAVKIKIKNDGTLKIGMYGDVKI